MAVLPHEGLFNHDLIQIKHMTFKIRNLLKKKCSKHFGHYFLHGPEEPNLAQTE